MFKLIISLTIITVICGGILGFIYNLTKEPISKAEILEKGLKINSVFSSLDLDNNPIESKFPIVNENGDTSFAYLALKGNDTIGIAIEDSGVGYSGWIKVLTGINLTNGEITSIEILAQGETPGLGAKITENSFRDQFIGKALSNSVLVNSNFAVTKDGGDIDAISGATISPRAVCVAVSKSLHIAKNSNLIKEGGE